MKRIKLLAILTILAVSLAACGSDDKKQDANSDTTEVEADSGDTEEKNETTENSTTENDTTGNEAKADTAELDESRFFTITVEGVDYDIPTSDKILSHGTEIQPFTYRDDYDADSTKDTYRCKHCADEEDMGYATQGITFLVENEDGQFSKFQALQTGLLYSEVGPKVDDEDGLGTGDIYSCDCIRFNGVGFGSTPEEIMAVFGEVDDNHKTVKKDNITELRYYMKRGNEEMSYRFEFHTWNGVTRCYDITVGYDVY